MDDIKPFTTIRKWDDFVKLEQGLFSDRIEEWVFRGEAKLRAPKTTLERMCGQFGIPSAHILQLERVLIKEFQRIYPIYAPDQVPQNDDTIFWLSMMRHFGAPTRFLDFTFSLPTATFFALESPIEIDKMDGYERGAVWAISKTWLTKHSLRQMEAIGPPTLKEDWNARRGSAFEKIFWDEKASLKAVFPVNPLRLHERGHVQNGLFLCPGDASIGFKNNLLALRGWEKKVKVFDIDDSCRKEVLGKLGTFGVSRESLFPGLEGFAQSLRIAGPLIFQLYKDLEKNGGRIPTNSRNEFLYDQFSTNLD